MPNDGPQSDVETEILTLLRRLSEQQKATERVAAEAEINLRKILEQQKATARAVADLALGLNFEGRTARDRHSELQGLLLGLLSPPAPARATKSKSEPSQKFPVPGGEEGDSVVLTERTQKKIIRWVLLGLAAASLHVVQWALAAAHFGGH